MNSLDIEQRENKKHFQIDLPRRVSTAVDFVGFKVPPVTGFVRVD